MAESQVKEVYIFVDRGTKQPIPTNELPNDPISVMKFHKWRMKRRTQPVWTEAQFKEWRSNSLTPKNAERFKYPANMLDASGNINWDAAQVFGLPNGHPYYFTVKYLLTERLPLPTLVEKVVSSVLALGQEGVTKESVEKSVEDQLRRMVNGDPKTVPFVMSPLKAEKGLLYITYDPQKGLKDFQEWKYVAPAPTAPTA